MRLLPADSDETRQTFLLSKKKQKQRNRNKEDDKKGAPSFRDLVLGIPSL